MRAFAKRLIAGLKAAALTTSVAAAAIASFGVAAPVHAQTIVEKSSVPGRGVNDDRKWAVSMFYGFASTGDSEMFTAPRAWWDSKFREESLVGGALSYNVLRFLRYFTLEAEIGVGHRFGIGATEGWMAGYVRYDNFPWNHVVRTTVAASIGVNYITRLPVSEDPVTDPNHPRSKLLHYFSPEITFALPDSPQHELVFRVHHRSGVWGLFNGVRGGADAFVVGYRYRF